MVRTPSISSENIYPTYDQLIGVCFIKLHGIYKKSLRFFLHLPGILSRYHRWSSILCDGNLYCYKVAERGRSNHSLVEKKRGIYKSGFNATLMCVVLTIFPLIATKTFLSSSCTCIGFGFITLHGYVCWAENRRRNNLGEVAQVDRAFMDLTDKEVCFVPFLEPTTVLETLIRSHTTESNLQV